MHFLPVVAKLTRRQHISTKEGGPTPVVCSSVDKSDPMGK